MPGNPKECLDHAKACMRLASEARRPSDRQHFEELAQRWQALARDLEVTQRLLATWGDDAKPKS
jgi:hypothetical protein